MAPHARPHTRKPGDGPLRYRFVAVLGAGDLAPDVNVVRELERLLDNDRMTPQEVVERGRKRRARRGEDVRRLPGKQLRTRLAGHVLFENAAADPARQRHTKNEGEARERDLFGALRARETAVRSP